jgi:hypothetical protein
VIRRILLVSFFYPPSREAGVHRAVAMAKYLRRTGHEVTVLSTSAYGTLPDDAERGIVRSHDLQVTASRLRLRRGGDVFERGEYDGRRHPLSAVIVPEPTLVAWAPFAIAKAVALHRRIGFDAVVTTSPPESAHVVGWALQRIGLPWVADVRDGWTFETFRPPWPTELQRRLEVALERALFRRADVVTCVAQALADDVRTRIGGNGVVVTNGWDPELAAGAVDPSAAERLLDPQRRSLVYTGRLAFVDRDVTVLVRALARLARAEPDVAARLELVFAGSYTEEERRLFATDVAPARIVVAGSLPREQSLGLQQAADANLLVTAGTRRHEVTGKLFEYLGASRPIIALAHRDEAARIVAETEAGRVVAHHDEDAAADALRALAAGELRPPAEEAVRRYCYPGVAERMLEAIEDAIARR